MDRDNTGQSDGDAVGETEDNWLKDQSLLVTIPALPITGIPAWYRRVAYDLAHATKFDSSSAEFRCGLLSNMYPETDFAEIDRLFALAILVGKPNGLVEVIGQQTWGHSFVDYLCNLAAVIETSRLIPSAPFCLTTEYSGLFDAAPKRYQKLFDKSGSVTRSLGRCLLKATKNKPEEHQRVVAHMRSSLILATSYCSFPESDRPMDYNHVRVSST